MNLAEFGFNCLFGLGIFLLSVTITRLMIRINIVDKPNERSSHIVPTPRSGGVAIVLSFTLGAFIVLFLESRFDLPMHQFFAVIVGAFFMAFIAFIDDVKGLRQIIKFSGQFLSIIVILASGLYFKQLSFPFANPIELSPILGMAITLCWFLFFMNAFNFMDGLNGLAGGSALVASIFMSILGYLSGFYVVYILSMILAFAILGFLIFNFPKGKIFLGDTGSQYVALILAVIGVIASQSTIVFVSEMSVPFLFFIFVFDVILTIIKRLMRRENIFQAHKSHLYQMVNQSGFSHVFVTILHLGFMIIGGLSVLYLYRYGPENTLKIFAILFSIAVVYAVIVQRVYGRSIK
ncbi:MAG: glycosyltransferase family 4 protein [Alphaproteobacteria bacterium]|nr:glycosyltransferase family 4 protein [Alphaproteobacteria bacterium]